MLEYGIFGYSYSDEWFQHEILAYIHFNQYIRQDELPTYSLNILAVIIYSNAFKSNVRNKIWMKILKLM